MQHYGVLSFHQEYIDNWDAGQVVDRSEHGLELEAKQVTWWQAQVQVGYKQWGVPRSVDESIYGLESKALGADIGADRGWIGLSSSCVFFAFILIATLFKEFALYINSSFLLIYY